MTLVFSDAIYIPLTTVEARTRNMEQEITYWPPLGNDGFGGVEYAAPDLIIGRYQRKNELFRDDQAREVVSSAIVYTGQGLETKGYLALGDYTKFDNPISLEEAYEIRSVGESPNLRNSEVLNKAWL